MDRMSTVGMVRRFEFPNGMTGFFAVDGGFIFSASGWDQMEPFREYEHWHAQEAETND